MKLENLKAGQNKIQFISKTMGGNLKLSGLLFVPDDFDETQKYPTIVFTGPFNQIKEQMGAFYGRKLAKKGYIFLAFDHQGYGESEGQIRNYEYFPSKIEGIHDAVSFLRMHDFVDREKLYGIGACAGATHMAFAAVGDKRIKRVAFVSGMLVNTAVHFTFNKRSKIDQMLEDANEARQQFYETGELVQFDALKMDEGKDSKIRDVREGYEYYMTERAGAATYSNYAPMTPEFFLEDNVRHSARAIARYINTPTLTVYGTKASTKLFSWLFHWAKKGPKKKFAVKGASHVDLYDVDKYVDQVVAKTDSFFKADKIGCCSCR